MNDTFFGLTPEQWLQLGASVVLVAATLVIARWLVWLIVDQGLRRLARRSRTSLDDAILNALRTPLYWFLVIFVTEYAIQRLDFIPASWQPWLENIFYVSYLVTGFFLAGKLVHNLFIWYGKEMALKTESELDEQLLPFFRRIALVILGAIGLIMLFSVLLILYNLSKEVGCG